MQAPSLHNQQLFRVGGSSFYCYTMSLLSLETGSKDLTVEEYRHANFTFLVKKLKHLYVIRRNDDKQF